MFTHVCVVRSSIIIVHVCVLLSSLSLSLSLPLVRSSIIIAPGLGTVSLGGIIAILSGDVMMIRTYQLMLKVDSDILKDVLDVFSKAAIEVCEGQQLDMDFESQKEDPSKNENTQHLEF